MRFLVWLTVTKLVMVLHYRLFKRGSFFSHSKDKHEEKSRVGCFEFCRGPADSPASKMLTGFAAMLLDPDVEGRQYLTLLHSQFGPDSDEWPLELLTCLHITLVLAFTRAWRLLVYFFRHYPWPLAPCFDPGLSQEQREEHMNKFLAVPKGSPLLDPGCGRKLREAVDSVQDLLEPTLFEFMQVMFTRLVMTSTFVERLFKDLTTWTSRPGQYISTVGAKYMNVCFKRTVERWRSKENATSLKLGGLHASTVGDRGVCVECLACLYLVKCLYLIRIITNSLPDHVLLRFLFIADYCFDAGFLKSKKLPLVTFSRDLPSSYHSVVLFERGFYDPFNLNWKSQ